MVLTTMIIGIDIGTTNVKAAAFNEQGGVLALAERPSQTNSPQSGWQEQDPEAIFQNVLAVWTDVLAQTAGQASLRAVAFSCAMHGLIAVDQAGKPLTPALLWSDLRAADIADRWHREGRAMELYNRTGVPVHAMSPLCKIAWLREQQPEIFRATTYFLGIKEYVLWCLTGNYLSDLSLASATGLLNLQEQHWDELALHMAGIEAARLPGLISPYAQLRLLHYWSGRLGWSATASLFAGASDGCLANLGAGATAPGDAVLTIGTSGALRVAGQAPCLDAQGRTFCYRLDEMTFITGGATNNGANVLAWLSALLGQGHTAEQLIALAMTIPPGADGLIFLPYLHGERAPLWDAQARGGFWGLAAHHGPAHLVRAALEGVVYNLQWISELVATHQPVQRLFATGGFTASAFWLQLAADIFGQEIVVADTPGDASVRGAVLLARRALGKSMWPLNLIYQRFQPDPLLQARYAKGRLRFRQLAAALLTIDRP